MSLYIFKICVIIGMYAEVIVRILLYKIPLYYVYFNKIYIHLIFQWVNQQTFYFISTVLTANIIFKKNKKT